MKKFTKWCLITALVLFTIGCVFCGVFGIFGGFEQLRQEGRYGLFQDGSVVVLDMGLFHFPLFDYDDDWHYGAEHRVSGSEAENTDCRASEITDIDIELGAACLVIEESADDCVWIRNDSSIKNLKYGMNNGTFVLYGNRNKFNNMFHNENDGTVYLSLPKGLNLNSVEMEIYAGQIENLNLEANTIELESGAGIYDIDSLRAKSISMDVGAGEMNIGSMSAETVSISVGAGTVDVKNADVAKDLDLEVGMGSISVQGKIMGDMDAECAMGEIDITLQGSESEHNYTLECGMGNVIIGGNEYGGIAKERKINNGSSSYFDIECAMGSITIKFED
ncbi:MAG: DUF4097 domain-containing protein [Clostridiales bacterium]|nr:DUF4097 domain-containing protein [Clostridiales bacterium]